MTTAHLTPAQNVVTVTMEDVDALQQEDYDAWMDKAVDRLVELDTDFEVDSGDHLLGLHIAWLKKTNGGVFA